MAGKSVLPAKGLIGVANCHFPLPSCLCACWMRNKTTDLHEFRQFLTWVEFQFEIEILCTLCDSLASLCNEVVLTLFLPP